MKQNRPNVRVRGYALALVFVGLFGLLFLKTHGDRVRIDRDIDRCSKSTVNTQVCYRDIVSRAVRVLSFRDAQAVFGRIAQDTRLDCHDLAHFFGQMTFFKTGGLPAPIDEQSLYLCANGFWHGFMTAYTWEHKDRPQDIVQLCSAHPEIRHYELNCYHGVGIGSVGDPPDVTTWGNEPLIIANAIGACETIAPMDNARLECASGVFHEIVNDKLAGVFGLPHVNAVDPLAFCETQEKQYVDICIGQLASRLHTFANNDPAQIIPLLAPHIEDPTFLTRMFALALKGLVVSMPEENINALFASCRTLPPQERAACIGGVTDGHLERGVPREQIDKTYALCEAMDNEDRQVCNERLVEFATRSGLPERVRTLCARMATSDYKVGTSCD